MRIVSALATFALLASAGYGQAAQPGMKMKAAGQSASAKAYIAANKKMMMDMNKRPKGSADKGFVMMMIPHHQGAVAMAKVELRYGKDPMLRTLARHIVRSQEKEIKQMKSWSAAHGG